MKLLYMKLLIASISLLLLSFKMQSSFYDLQLTLLDGTAIHLSAYSEKKIVVYEFNANAPDYAQLLYLDSIQGAMDSIQVIAVPATDFSGSGNVQDLHSLKNSLNLSYYFTQPALVKKSAGANQLPLFRWLTHLDGNTHFDREVDAAGEIYVINEQGILYAVLGHDTPIEAITKVIGQAYHE